MACELCDTEGGTPVWHDARCRVVHAAEPGYPGFCRVIWNAHVAEMTDLGEADRAHCMRVVFALEAALREMLHPDKINLASLGNVTPHLHWHVIPRFRGDAHFPNPIWGASLRPSAPSALVPGEFVKTLAGKLSRL
jgi:diadenosine tetraphosphate (Ap4A) HIT family hydrolase